MAAPDSDLLADLLGPSWRLLYYTEDSIAWIARSGNRDGTFDTIKLSREATLTVIELAQLGEIRSTHVEKNKTVTVVLRSNVIIDLMKPGFAIAYHMREEVEQQNPGIRVTAALDLGLRCAMLADALVERLRDGR